MSVLFIAGQRGPRGIQLSIPCHACVPSVSHGAISVFSLPIATGSGLSCRPGIAVWNNGIRLNIGARTAFASVVRMMAQVSRLSCRHPTCFPDPCKRHWRAVNERNIERRFGLLARSSPPLRKARSQDDAAALMEWLR